MGAAECLMSYVGAAPFYMLFDGIAHEEELPPFGPVPWLLTALAIAIAWQVIFLITKAIRDRAT